MKIIKNAVATCESIAVSTIPKGEPGWDCAPAMNVVGRTTWSNIIIDFEDTPYLIGQMIDTLQIDNYKFQGVMPIGVIGNRVECSIQSAFMH